MFKVGGEANTHGVGITSGLEYRRPGYNAGGQVEPQATFGVGNNANKDASGREKHGFFLPLAARAGQSGIMALLNALKGGYKTGFFSKPGKAFGSMKDTLGRYIKLGRTGKGYEGLKIGEYGSMPTKRAIDAALKSGDPKKIKAIKDAMFKYGTSGKVLRGARLATAPAGLGITGAGLASAALPDIPESAQDKVPLLNLLQGGRDWLLEPTANFSPLGALGYGLTGSSLTGLVEGKKDKKIGSESVDTTTAMGTQKSQEDEFAKMKEDAEKRAELYYSLMSEGGSDKVGAIADAFTNAGMLYDESKSKAIAGFSQGITDETDRQRDIKGTAMQAAISDVIGADAQKNQMIEQAKLALMSSPDLSAEQRKSAVQGLEAYAAGIVDILPTTEKGDEVDTTRMAPGTIYFDPANLYGGMYVVKPITEGAEIKAFTTLQEAEAHARS